jgi:hypothetical protein
MKDARTEELEACASFPANPAKCATRGCIPRLILSTSSCVNPLGRVLQLCDVPGPNFVWTHCLVQVWCRQDDAVACGAHGLRY